MTTASPTPRALDRDELLAIAPEYMLAGMLTVKAVGPVLALRPGLDEQTTTEIGINQQMGASPIYTRRMRAVMRIEGDDIVAIMKALQLDVGFVHEYTQVTCPSGTARLAALRSPSRHHRFCELQRELLLRREHFLRESEALFHEVARVEDADRVHGSKWCTVWSRGHVDPAADRVGNELLTLSHHPDHALGPV